MGGALLSESVTGILIPVAAVIGIGFALLQWVLVSRVKVGPDSSQMVFFTNFTLGMLKMGQLYVLTGAEGEICSNFSIANSSSSSYQQIIEFIVGHEEERSRSSQFT